MEWVYLIVGQLLLLGLMGPTGQRRDFHEMH